MVIGVNFFAALELGCKKAQSCCRRSEKPTVDVNPNDPVSGETGQFTVYIEVTALDPLDPKAVTAAPA